MKIVPQRTRSASKASTVYWITTCLAALLFIVPGLGLFLGAAHFINDMAQLGYPPYFLKLLGTWKILGAIAILLPRFPRLKEWAYAGMIFDLSGAVVSRAVMGSGGLEVFAPMLVGVLVAASWTLRPADRRVVPFPSRSTAPVTT